MDKELKNSSNDEILLDYAAQLKEDNDRLKKELDAKKQPKIFIGKELSRSINNVLNSELFNTFFVIGIICMVILTICHVWPSTYETGRFYLKHQMHDYKPPEDCPANAFERYKSSHNCVVNAVDVDSCYIIIGEVKNGSDNKMSKCIRKQDEAYKIANEFTDEWKKLKAKNRNVEYE